VVADIPVDVPRPRRIESPEVAALSMRITDQLRQEVASHGDH
jgi:NitT/TauT family transport system ATP-binding protein